MKTSHLILTAFLAAAAWADNSQSRERVASTENTNVVSETLKNSKKKPSALVFFAKLNETFYPLHNYLIYEDSRVFAYGMSHPPTEIILQNEYAKAANDSVFAGFKDEFFALSSGDAFDYVEIKVDENGKVQSQTFFSCISEFSEYRHIINYNEEPASCSEAEVYLGRYNPGTGQYMKIDFGALKEGTQAQTPRRKWKNWPYLS